MRTRRSGRNPRFLGAEAWVFFWQDAKRAALPVFLAALCLAASAVAGNFPGYHDTVRSARGHVISGARITVYLDGTTTLATIYTEKTGSTTSANPVVAGSDGSYKFFAAPGFYKLSIAAGGYNPTTITSITLAGVADLDVTMYGARGDGVTDDTAAIQAAFDAVETAGGGSVYLPTGTYLLGTTQTATSSHYSSGQRNLLLLKPGVSIVGNGPSSIFKVASTVGNYVAIFAQNADADSLQNVVYADFAVDFNSANTVTLPDSASTVPCFGFMVWTSENVTWDKLHFDNVATTSAIYQGGREDQNRDNTVSSCVFDNVGYGTTYYDASIVRLDCERSTVTDNVFVGDAAKRGATTAIETHGRGQYVSGNQIHNFQQMMNIGGIAVHSSVGVIVTGNIGYNVGSGIRLWSFRDTYDTGGDVDYGFDGLTITDNVINLGKYWPAVEQFRSGIWTGPYSSRLCLPYRNVTIARNTISYDIDESTSGVVTSEYSAGILLNEFPGDDIGRRFFYNVTIEDNTIERPFFQGIRLRGVMRDVTVRNNFIEAAGSADPAVNDGDVKSYRAGIFAYCDTFVTRLDILDNTLIAGSGTDSVGIYLGSSGVDTLWTVARNKTNGYQVPVYVGSGVGARISPINVWDFGAVGDGTTDDTAAIQAAIDAAEAVGGGQVHFPAGLYRIESGPLTVNLDDGTCEQISLVGEGKHESRLLLYASGTENLLEIDGWRTSARSFKVQDMGFSLASGTGGDAIEVLNASRGLIDECYIYGFAAGAGIKFDAENSKNCDLNKVTNTYVGACQDGIWNDLSGTTATYCDAQFITNCTLVSNTRYDIHSSNSGGLAGKANAMLIGDTWIQSVATGTHGIYLTDDVTGVKVSNVNIDGSPSTQAITIGASCGYSLWANIVVDGTYSDSSGLAQFSATYFSTSPPPTTYFGSGTPEGSVTGAIGSIYMRTDGGASTSLYVKESGTGNTGWVAK